jgi:hypothetical protein
MRRRRNACIGAAATKVSEIEEKERKETLEEETFLNELAT